MLLHNLYSRKKLKKIILLKNIVRINVSFYKYFKIKNTIFFRNMIYIIFNKYNILGRIYVSKEGINAQISIPKKNYNKSIYMIYKLNKNLYNIHINKSIKNDKLSFLKLIVKVKPKILNDNINENFDFIKNKGIYLNVSKVNNLIFNKNYVFVDIRNNYEYELGHFINSIQIKSINFRNQINNLLKKLIFFKKKKIVLYCTGGIRCEKVSTILKYNNFKKVYQIKGGIISYIRYIKKYNLPNYFIGKNFVFDNRMCENVSYSIISNCHQCKSISYNYVNCLNNKCHILFIQCFSCKILFKKFCSIKCMKLFYKN
ncbi:oxygen-dependent tRNA uridine(34) hydroxylase TrhO [Candidatus Annandia adelgestsuga]|uniref:oxygen-dependent tRNA uridine(34) hydroxylase TrhO n=1 Tax=Candidatus Annandia adelgestsuga TaxID=1302411 RepID=UPI000F7ECBFB|nr:rhodanese-related sulfurtransferase [Candidatus Annandia adelgestsuga]